MVLASALGILFIGPTYAVPALVLGLVSGIALRSRTPRTWWTLAVIPAMLFVASAWYWLREEASSLPLVLAAAATSLYVLAALTVGRPWKTWPPSNGVMVVRVGTATAQGAVVGSAFTLTLLLIAHGLVLDFLSRTVLGRSTAARAVVGAGIAMAVSVKRADPSARGSRRETIA